jgi:hypothetical protein
VTAYVYSDVAAVLRLYGGLLGSADLDRFAGCLADGHRQHLAGAAVVLRNWHPRVVDMSDADLWAMPLTEADFRLAVAREHGFADWAAVGHPVPSPSFEAGVEAVLGGELDALARLLAADSALVAARSHWGHRATLLHYLAANGVETYRQRVPRNAAEVARLLRSGGADVHATAHAYGREMTTVDLLVSSAHPLEAGVTDGLLTVLREPDVKRD